MTTFNLINPKQAPDGLVILIPSVVIITLLFLVSAFIGFGDADAQEQNVTDEINLLFERGLALQDLGQYNESIVYYDKALAIDPNNVDVLENKRLALENLR